ncbi:BOI-related E3 ubiquitin-protein ligase 1-like [Phalaenopsis equestris]|uniref:BOI-related E3 ubiquitin-protein ligase 1-like n=1 Tax=Phalaenopsis equestris TaxID=78828 RepID=UPI0009E62DDC|nr:BOI-related E3 ubiquitin-protein ligase 1-like [Phalaenopsis equestris]
MNVPGSRYLLPAEPNYDQQQLLKPLDPFSTVLNAAAASDFHCSKEFNNSNLAGIVAAGRNHNEKVDSHLLMQALQLNAILEQQWKQQLSSLTMTLKAKFINLLMQKEKHLAEEKKKAMKLIALLNEALLEKEKWEKTARKLNSMASALSQTLEQVQQPCLSSTGELKKEEDEDEDEPSAKRKKGNISHDSSSLCQSCRWRSASVLVLPCRHLSLCKQCEVLHCRCPVCKCIKKGAMEVLVS